MTKNTALQPSATESVDDLIARLAADARDAQRVLSRLDDAARAAGLRLAAGAMRTDAGAILAANARDMAAGAARGLSGAMLDRLLLDAGRIGAIADGLDAVAALPGPVGQVIDTREQPNGLVLSRVRVPIGVIGIAIGTVLLPDMSRRISANDHAGAMAAQRRAFDFTLLFSVPFVAAFLTVPDVIMRAMFARGAFTKADAAAAGATLAAYAVGLIPFVLIRSAVATFYARKDTATPVKSALTGIAVNLEVSGEGGGDHAAVRGVQLREYGPGMGGLVPDPGGGCCPRRAGRPSPKHCCGGAGQGPWQPAADLLHELERVRREAPDARLRREWGVGEQPRQPHRARTLVGTIKSRRVRNFSPRTS